MTLVVFVDNIQVRFFETTEDGLVWEAYGDFGQGDVHRQVRIEGVKYVEGERVGREHSINMLQHSTISR